MRTYHPKIEEIQKKWFIVDLAGKTLGRATTEIARVLSGKNKPVYSPAVDTGDFVVVINADQVKLTGNKLNDKMYYSYSGYMGGLKSISARDLLQKDPAKLIQHAVRGMLPKNKLGRKLIKKLKVYKDATHDHSAQKPEILVIK